MTRPRRRGTPRPRGRAGERGFALLVVLWTLALASLVGARVTAAGRGELRLAADLRAAAEAEALADGAVHEAVFRLLDPSPAGWRADGRPRSLVLPGGTAEVRAEDRAGHVNPNAAAPELLAALFGQAGLDARAAADLAAAVVEWRIPGPVRPPGAKEAAYRAAGLGHAPSEAPFRSLDELGGVLGMTPALLARLAPHLDLHAGGAPDPGLAGPVVLAALRALAGGAALAPLPRDGERTVAVTAAATGPGGARFVRRAVVRIGTAEGRPWRVLDWARTWDGAEG